MMEEDNRSNMDKILDLLLEAMLERQQARGDTRLPEPELEPEVETETETETELEEEGLVEPEPEPEPVFEPKVVVDWIEEVVDEVVEETAVSYIPEKLPSIHLEKMLGRLAVAMVLLLIVVNIPFNRFGTSLARAMPDTASLIIRDGLVFKGDGEEIYVLEDNKKRWITSLDAFNHYGYRWEQVRVVDEAFLEQFENGRPIYLLIKCLDSPHVYALENGEKRWIKDIPTFVANGFVWEDVRNKGCSYVRGLPDGVPIPPDAGTPPQP